MLGTIIIIIIIVSNRVIVIIMIQSSCLMLYVLNNKIQVASSASSWDPHSCVRNSITYFGSFIKGVASLNDMVYPHTFNSEITEGQSTQYLSLLVTFLHLF